MSVPNPSDPSAGDFPSFDDVFSDITQPVSLGPKAVTFEGWDFNGEHKVFADIASRDHNLNEQEFYSFEVQETTIGSIFPPLAGSDFGNFKFRKTTLEIWTRPIGSHGAGVYLSTEIDLQAALAALPEETHFFVRTFFPDEIILRLSAYFSVAQNPNNVLHSNGLILRGSVGGMTVPFFSAITFISLGVEFTLGKPGATNSCRPFGQLLFNLPGRITPLYLDFYADSDEDYCHLSMTYSQTWQDAFGVTGFSLTNVRLRHSVSRASVEEKLRESVEKRTETKGKVWPPTKISATWQSSTFTITLEGEIFHGEEKIWKRTYLKGTLENKRWADVCSIYSDMTGKTVAPTDHEIELEKLSVAVSWGRLELKGAVVINGRRAADASIVVSSSGISISGAVHDVDIGENCVIDGARLEFAIGNANMAGMDQGGWAADPWDDYESGNSKPPTSSSTGKPDVEKEVSPTKGAGTTAGTPQPSDKSVTKPEEAPVEKPKPEVDQTQPSDKTVTKPEGASVAKPKPEVDQSWRVSMKIVGIVRIESVQFHVGFTVRKGKSGNWEWRLVGMTKTSISLRHFVTCIEEGAEMDISLRDVRLHASHVDGKNELSVSALLDKLPGLGANASSAARIESYVMRAGYSSQRGISVCIILPQSMQIKLGSKCSAENMALRIETATGQLFIIGRVKVLMDGVDEPISFDLALKADPVGFQGDISMKGYYANPFGLGKHIELGICRYLNLQLSFSPSFSNLKVICSALASDSRGHLWLSELRQPLVSPGVFV
ncbi:hypothetical protein JAAARDRAFT_446596 [Jaapia argillacea MUCL 33604]|uniref:Uncharacterized protein n=1 Tax=Jaapia argillacea MUCL 33604 TaxID=933084 RepID=A0A067PNP8_9AGAM|nr:hypothetical protein JAAARDRAFT_446596 [Jaapia argillacea MUCL 33604]